MISLKAYNIGKYTLIWEFDFDESDVSKMQDNNLYIEGIWNIKDISPKDTLCTGVHIIDSETFSFTTFCGMKHVMKVKDEGLEHISTMLVK